MYIIMGGLAGILLGSVWMLAWRNIPQKWFCEYGQAERCAPLHKENRRLLGVFVILVFFMFGIALSCTGDGEVLSFLLKSSLVWILLQAAVGDFYFQIVADQWIVALLLLSAVKIISEGKIGELGTLFLSAILIAVLLWSTSLFLSVLFRQEVLGFGDIKLFFSLCLYFGFDSTLWILMCAMVLCGIGCGLLLLLKVYQKESTCPLVPYIALASGLLLIGV